MGVKTYYIDGYFWRHPDPKWDIEFYGTDTKGKGDIIYNTMARIIDQEDESEWAYKALYECAFLLMSKRRWPIKDDQECDAKTAIGWRFNQLVRKLRLTKKVKYRWNKSITRDPFKAFYCAAIILQEERFIELVKMPWFIYSPKTWKWRKRLINDKRKLYVQRMDHYTSIATVLKTSENHDILQNIEDSLKSKSKL